jgi:hypothetical protein
MGQASFDDQPGAMNQASPDSHADAASQPTANHAGSAPPAQGTLPPRLALPPWARVPVEFSAATAPANLPDWIRGAGSGPMYVWNPATNSGPFPALGPDNE